MHCKYKNWRKCFLNHSMGNGCYCKPIPGLFHKIDRFHWYQSSVETTYNFFSTLSALSDL
mgnify:FL=1